jgi:hypothetical protein
MSAKLSIRAISFFNAANTVCASTIWAGFEYKRRPKQIGLLAFATGLIVWGASPANAEVIRFDYNNASNPNYARYFTLANNPAFNTIGSLSISMGPAGGGGCTGSLISANIVLTAAHCVTGSTSSNGSLFGITFSGGPVVRNPPPGTSTQITYSGNADRVLPNPAYSGAATDSAHDVALVRIPSLTPVGHGSVPTNYLPLYTGSGELRSPPNIAVTIGYGERGDGVNGVPNRNTIHTDGVKLGGLTLLNSIPPNSQSLSATFLNPGIFGQGCSPCMPNDPRLLPSNFLEAFPVHGDSGGPLLSNLLGTNGYAIIGVMSTISGPHLDANNDPTKYGDTAVWARVSSLYSWIQSAISTLSGLPAAIIAGTTPSNPLSPVNVVTNAFNTVVRSFTTFVSALTAYFFDPPTTATERVTLKGGPPISSIFIPVGSGGNIHLFLFDPNTGKFDLSGILIPTGAWFDFATPLTDFELSGLSSQNTNFGFEFSNAGVVDLDLTSNLAVTPLPPALPLFATGLGAVGLLGWIRNRKNAAALRAT